MIFAPPSYGLAGIAALFAILIILRRRKRSGAYLFFFSIFWIYLLFVFSAIIFPIAPLPESYSGIFRPSINLTPFYFGPCSMPEHCFENIVGNILLTIPFGFGVSFVLRLKPKDFLWLAILLGLVFETVQLIISFTFRSSFRIVDVNDVLLNAIGVWIGYGLFRVFGYLYLSLIRRFKIRPKHLFAFIQEIVHQAQ